MYTIGQVAKCYALSRSTLLYYDRIGLLRPSGRSAADYRLYSARDLKRMDRIVLFRSAGLPLEAIAGLLEQEEDQLDRALEGRLAAINDEIQHLRGQQQVILKILENEGAAKHTRVLSKDTWVGMLRAAGLDEDGMRNWHVEFERTSPEGHQDFLESIGIDGAEIEQIREWSRT